MDLTLQRTASAMKHQTLFAVVGVFAGCSFSSKEPDPPAFDRDAPRVHIVSPARGAIAGDVTHVLVSGTAADESGSLASVTVNGVAATLADDGSWSVDVAVAPGTNLLHAIAIDARRNQAEETRAVVVGPMVDLDGHVESGIRATLSAQALSTLGRDTATYLESGGLMKSLQAMNPLVDVGGGPDCLYARASIGDVTLADADVQLQPTSGGVSVSAVLESVQMTVHLQWAVSCVEASRDVVLTAQRASVKGLLAIGVVDRKLDVQFDQPNVQITGADVQLPDVPPEIEKMLALDTAMSVSLGLVTERIVVPMVDQSLDALADARTIQAAGMRLDLSVEPTQVSFTAEGGTIALDTSLRAYGDRGQFVFVANRNPVFDMTQGFQLALADDAANQLLASMWSAKAFDSSIDFAPGSYGKISEHYDSVQLQLAAPPHVDANGKPLELTIGDWIATFKVDDIPATTVAIHAQSALYVVAREDGKLHLDVSTPSVVVDVLDGADQLTKAQYEAIRSFAFERIRTLGSEALGTIPLPVLGNITLPNLWMNPQDGYLFVNGEVR